MTGALKRQHESTWSPSAKRVPLIDTLNCAFLLPAYGRQHASRGAFVDRVQTDCGFTLWAQGKRLAASRWQMICSVKGCHARVVYRKDINGAGIYLIEENPGHSHEIRQPPEPAPPSASGPVQSASPETPEPEPTEMPEPCTTTEKPEPETSKPEPRLNEPGKTSKAKTSKAKASKAEVRKAEARKAKASLALSSSFQSTVLQ